MKTLTTLISLFAIQFVSMAQSNSTTFKKSTPSEIHVIKSYFINSSDDEVVKSAVSPFDKNKTIVIANIPNATSVLTTVNIDLNEMGTYTFIKAESLIIPYNQVVLIEDKVSGLLFNITSVITYKFKVEQNNLNRFVMHVMDKTISEEEVVVK